MKDFKKVAISITRFIHSYIKWVGMYVILVTLILFSCRSNPKYDRALLMETTNDSIKMSISIFPNQLAKFKYENKFIGIIPIKLEQASQVQEIEFYVVDEPTFKFEEFTIENIKSKKIVLNPPKKISSFDLLSKELNSSNLNLGMFVVSPTVAKSILVLERTLNDGTRVVKSCTCPCSLSDNNVTVSCD